LGGGQIAATYFSFSRGYLENRSPVMRSFLNNLVRQLFPNPLVQVDGSSTVDVSVNRLSGKLAIHLVNTSGTHWDRKNPLITTIPSVGPIEVTIRTPKRPARVILQPGNQPLAFTYSRKLTRVTVPGLDIHSILIIE
jgi:hypothetical protein